MSEKASEQTSNERDYLPELTRDVKIPTLV